MEVRWRAIAAELKALKCSQEVTIVQFAKQFAELACQYFEWATVLRNLPAMAQQRLN